MLRRVVYPQTQQCSHPRSFAAGQADLAAAFTPERLEEVSTN